MARASTQGSRNPVAAANSTPITPALIEAQKAVEAAEADLTAAKKAAEQATGDDGAAKAAEAVTAAEDALAQAKAKAEEEQAKIDAEAMRQADEAAAAELEPIMFDTRETGYDFAGLQALLDGGAVLIFGYDGLSLPSVPVQPTHARDWTVTGGAFEFAGTITMLLPNDMMPVTADCVALADSADGPIRAYAALGGALLLTPGGEYQFGRGAFVIEGARA